MNESAHTEATDAPPRIRSRMESQNAAGSARPLHNVTGCAVGDPVGDPVVGDPVGDPVGAPVVLIEFDGACVVLGSTIVGGSPQTWQVPGHRADILNCATPEENTVPQRAMFACTVAHAVCVSSTPKHPCVGD